MKLIRSCLSVTSVLNNVRKDLRSIHAFALHFQWRDTWHDRFKLLIVIIDHLLALPVNIHVCAHIKGFITFLRDLPSITKSSLSYGRTFHLFVIGFSLIKLVLQCDDLVSKCSTHRYVYIIIKELLLVCWFSIMVLWMLLLIRGKDLLSAFKLPLMSVVIHYWDMLITLILLYWILIIRNTRCINDAYVWHWCGDAVNHSIGVS
jgi:hypothetical protein